MTNSSKATKQPNPGGDRQQEHLTPHPPLHDQQSETRQRIQPPLITL